MTLRIHKSDARNRLVLTLIGWIQTDQVSELEALLTSVTDCDSVVLDLKDVKSLDRDAVLLFARSEAAGTKLRNCSAFIRELITRERRTLRAASPPHAVQHWVLNVVPPTRQQTTEKPQWYAARAASLNAQLEGEKARLTAFIEALDDARELKSTNAGINLAEQDRGIRPEATIDILQNRVRETQRELDQLEDLVGHNDIPPGILRSPSSGVSPTTAVTAIQDDKSVYGGD